MLVAFLAMLVGDADRQNASAESRAVTSTAREFLKNLVMRAALTSEFRVVVVNLGDGSATNVPVAGNGAIPGGSILEGRVSMLGLVEAVCGISVQDIFFSLMCCCGR